jgi:phosphatidate cytidylyltransferase
MAMNWPTFFTRLGSAVVFCIVMLAGLLWNEYSFIALVALIQFLCLKEYFSLIKKIYPNLHFSIVLQAVVQLFGALLVLSSNYFLNNATLLFPALLFIPISILLFESLTSKGSMEAAFKVFGALFYITLPMTLLLQLYEKSWMIPLALILMIWTNDTMAYIVGSFIGKTPFSAISPKKTWEGTIGGALLTIAGACAWGYFTHYYRIQDWVVLALCASIAGTLGDLFESKLKRTANIKDSGSIMPGHGGALDRFDSLLVATPFAFCYAYLSMTSIPISIF